MNDRTQLLKGTLEGCILKVIQNEETYGYEISERLKAVGFPAVSEGTIYPLLLRLERNGLLTPTYRESPSGPRRKYYRLTELGMQALREFYHQWRQLVACMDRLFADGGRETNDHL
ncbi:MAG: PadR family transcriptional regulator [Alicyclobacillus herbarius]|uniref:PadR family transcriptional regulator n=1 Tax=Alicyclobacillus herbarius TaxID=122960 RepID=UPI002357CB9E|nr:PadR family transcriptional regulator [Alicyclobacillus herbarius]MCL6633322.1 PadR family transcriptional regulator [Alicyclobacillus herbarius]